MSNKEQINHLNKVKIGYQIKIATFLLLIIFSFLLLFIPLEELSIPIQKNMWNYLLKLATSAVFTYLLRIPLFATDILATGTRLTSKFFRFYYPSTIIISSYKITAGQGQDLWFDFFNLWGNPNCRYHSQWRTVLKRTYDCRLIFYMTKLLKYTVITVFVFLLVVFLLDHFNIYSYIIEFKHFFYLITVFIFYILLAASNKVNFENDEYVVTGCWYKYKEISLIEHSIVEREILNKYGSYKEAIDNFDQIKERIKLT